MAIIGKQTKPTSFCAFKSPFGHFLHLSCSLRCSTTGNCFFGFAEQLTLVVLDGAQAKRTEREVTFNFLIVRIKYRGVCQCRASEQAAKQKRMEMAKFMFVRRLTFGANLTHCSSLDVIAAQVPASGLQRLISTSATCQSV